MNFLQFDFETHNRDEAEKLIAMLSEQGFDGFEEDGMMLIAFIPESTFNQEEFEKTLERFSILAYSKTIVENINWNKKWEEEFEPVVVDKFVGIRAHFHRPLKNVVHEIVITPKMSFGTGHHATTWMMIKQMQKLDFKNKKILDFGTGTGVLAILAEKMGASGVLAIDNDEWSITNAIENCEQNNCTKITVQLGEKVPQDAEFDIILANINFNIIQSNLPSIANICKHSAKILLSGFLDTDEQAITNTIKRLGLNKISTIRKKDWIAILCEK